MPVMPIWSHVLYLWRNVFRRAQVERELDEELRAYVELLTAEKLQGGMGTAEARRAALLEVGGVEQVKEQVREVRMGYLLETAWQDFRYGARTLAKNPVFTAVALLTLALGIGANSAIFSVVNTVLLRPLPYKDPGRLVMLWEDNTKQGFPRNSLSPANFIDYREQNHVFEGMAALTNRSFNLTGAGEPERIDGLRVSANLLPILGAQAQLGRVFSPEEDQFGAGHVVILSNRLWQRRFGSDPAIVGKSITLNGEGHTVVGVMSPDFQFHGAIPGADDELWVPISFGPRESASRGRHYLNVIARLKPGVTFEQAQAEMSNIARQLQQQYPDPNAGIGSVVVPLHEQLVGDIRPALLVILGAVGFVLLIACANVANLLLARAAARQKEIATRVALGASQVRLVRQFLTESLLLSLTGGLVGLMLSLWGVSVLKSFIPENISQVKAITIDVKVLGFTLLVSLLTGIVFGLAPALQASKVNLNETLKEGGRDSAAGSRGNRVRALLVVAEVAVSLVLLIGAGLLINSFLRLRQVDPGFRAENLLTMRVALPQSKYPDHARRAAFYTEMLRKVEAIPGVRSAAVTSPLPLIYNGDSMGVTLEGRAVPLGQEPDVVTRVVSPQYFRSMGIRLLRGRELGDQDRADTSPVVVISETMARRYWPGEDPLGKRLAPGSADSHDDWITIVGVVNDVRQFELDAEPKPQMYLSYEQSESFMLRDLVVKTDVEPNSLAGVVRSTIWGIDKDQPVSNVATMEEVLSQSVERQRFSMLLLSVFAALALILAAVGIYGVMSYSVAQRTHEIGIRMALGAQTRDVLRLVVGQGLKLVLAGVAVGLLAAFALTRVMTSLLFNVSATDPVTYAAISLTLVGVALVACLVPSWRATKVDPLIALRSE
jgi:putative ABC transport system permease protein